jgi:serine protease Do
MDEFKPFDYNGQEPENEPATEPQAETEVAEEAVEEVTQAAEPVKPLTMPYIPQYSPINYSAVTPVKNTKPASRGLKFFALIMAAVIALTSACTAGYFLGKGMETNQNAVVGLAAKPANTDEMTAAQVYEKVNPSVVGITVYNSKGVAANATGVIYSADGYVVTNDHIYSEVGAAQFRIFTHDNKEYDAEFVAGDKVSDLAVLKIKGEKFAKASFGNSDQLIFGESVVAIGRPGGSENASSVTKGIISATSRRVQTTSSYSARLIETDTPINPGSSGGALVNMYGQVIGITSSKLASSEIDAVGYAIPTTVMKRIVGELIKHGKVLSRAKLGISYTAINSVTAKINKSEHIGLLVSEVSEDSDLYKKLSAGDIITHINGVQITDDDIVLDLIESCKAGDTISVTFVNKKGTKTVDAVLKANIGESSYSAVEKAPETKPDSSGGQGGQGGGAFDFPFGE